MFGKIIAYGIIESVTYCYFFEKKKFINTVGWFEANFGLGKNDS